jgi:hypothetical protein
MIEPARDSQPLPIPVRTLPLMLLFLAVGSVALVFTWSTVNRHSAAALQMNAGATRQHFAVRYWIDHGYFNSAGLAVRGTTEKPYFYSSSTGGNLISGFVVAKIYSAITGRDSWRLLALHNQLVLLLVSSLIGLLGFRLAMRAGTPALHAFILGASVQIAHFTFPDNLDLTWEVTGRVWWLCFATIFLLLEEPALEHRTRALTGAQMVSVFLLTYMEFIAGVAFTVSYAAITLIFDSDRLVFRRLVIGCVLPMLLALGIFAGQKTLVNVMRPDMPKDGSTFLFRTGFDGSTQYYEDHLDIAEGRDLARANWPERSRGNLFRWKWLFLAGTAALLTMMVAAMRSLIPQMAVIAVVSLLGAYVLYAALFSQAVVIHPYLYDVMLFTPLTLALFVVVPAFIESFAHQKGMVVTVVLFLAVWVAMVNMRAYAVRNPVQVSEWSGQ